MSVDFKYLLPGHAGEEQSLPKDFKLLSQADNIPFVKTISECLQAERNGLDGVIWDAEDYDQLEELIPKKAAYGWMLVSINIPVYFHLTKLEQLDSLKKVSLNGLFSEDVELLLNSQKKVETLLSE